MQFVVIAHDGKDGAALERRMSVRESHLKLAEEMFGRGKWLFASALLDDNGNMNGSIIFCDFPSKKELEEEWLKQEPYIIGKVWDEIIIRRARIAPHSSNRN